MQGKITSLTLSLGLVGLLATPALVSLPCAAYVTNTDDNRRLGMYQTDSCVQIYDLTLRDTRGAKHGHRFRCDDVPSVPFQV